MRHAVLLRGINLGSRNRIAMPELRAALTEAGFEDVASYVQSGNIVLSSPLKPAAIAERCRALIAERFGLEIPVITRTGDELAGVVAANPIPEGCGEPKRYQVTFLDGAAPADLAERLEELATSEERVAVLGREVYAFHPSGIARSKLWTGLAGTRLGVTGTSRNWTTVETLASMAGEP